MLDTDADSETGRTQVDFVKSRKTRIQFFGELV